LTDPRVFNAEFYRKLYPQLKLAGDAAAQREWTSQGAKECRRGSFCFNARDYLNRNTDFSKGDCVSAAEHFVVAGFNEGRIGAIDSNWVVFDFNYYVDPANNPDLNKLYTSHTWGLAGLQIHWLQHGITERRIRYRRSTQWENGPGVVGRCGKLECAGSTNCAAGYERDAKRCGAVIHERSRRIYPGNSKITHLVPGFAFATVAEVECRTDLHWARSNGKRRS
jgi:hypothetical protein